MNHERASSPANTVAGGGFLFSREEFFAALEPALSYLLEQGRGFRLGEAAVISRKVHTLDPGRPGLVSVVLSADAGQVFYHRQRPGEVVHLDLFHQVGEVDHHQVAYQVLEALRQAGAYYGLTDDFSRLGDYIDVQTATGGGRVTGALRYGQRESLRRAHLNHVHLTMRLAAERAGLLVFLVAAVERAVLGAGLEIRRVEQVINEAGQPGGPQDLSDYQTDSDSLLKERASGTFSQQFRDLKTALDLAEGMGGINELADLFSELALEPAKRQRLATMARQDPSFSETVSDLVRRGFLRREEEGLTLTEEGWRLREFILQHRQELEENLKRALRKIPWRAGSGLKPELNGKPVRPAASGYRRQALPLPEGEWPGEVAVVETVLAGLRRKLTATLPDGQKAGQEVLAASGRRELPVPFPLEPADLWVNRRFQQRTSDICLLLDASASMAGPRLRAAKYLARHLVLSTRERVAVLIFQEKELRVVVPFSRSYARLEQGLRSIQPLGLTPLAEALVGSLDYLRSARAKNPLLLLISDGMPTVPKWTVNPIQDAQEAADRLGRMKINFGCIGLQPNRSFLEDLVRRAGGSLYVVEELEKGVLINIARQERERVKG